MKQKQVLWITTFSAAKRNVKNEYKKFSTVFSTACGKLKNKEKDN